MSEPTAGKGWTVPAAGDRQGLQELLQAWRDWIHLEATRARPYGTEAPGLEAQAREQREQCERAARALLGVAPGRADPVEMPQLEALLVEMEVKSQCLRSRLGREEVIRDAPLCGVLATQVAGCIALLWFLVGRGASSYR